jgi:hypothetical protein
MTTKEELIPYIAKVTENLKAFDIQIGGDHYKHYAIQPLQFIEANKLSFAEGCVVKYLMRYKDKGGIEDLKKAKHYIELIIENEYGNG